MIDANGTRLRLRSGQPYSAERRYHLLGATEQYVTQKV